MTGRDNDPLNLGIGAARINLAYFPRSRTKFRGVLRRPVLHNVAVADECNPFCVSITGTQIDYPQMSIRVPIETSSQAPPRHGLNKGAAIQLH